MNAQHLGGVVMGGLVLLVGVAWVLGAIRRVRERALSAPTYEATGGVVYTVFQVGCAGLLIVAGLVILVLMGISLSR
jgi:predicted transporter